MDFQQVDEARKILGLGQEASMAEIKEAFRKLALRYHPDRSKEEDKRLNEEMFQKIAHAKDIIASYCSKYRYSFREKDIKKNIISKYEYDHLKRFYDGWFGNLDL